MQAELNVIWDELLPALEAGETRWTPPPASAAPKFDMGADGELNGAFSNLAFDAAPNILGVARVELRQVADGLDLSLLFDDGFEDVVRAGYASDRRSALTHIGRQHCFEAYGRARWLSPTTAQMKLAVPAGTSFFTIDIDTAARTLHSATPIWFAQDWKADALVTAR